jgi:hypothetical protein
MGRFITTHNEKFNGMTESLKKVKEEQQSLDQRFSSTHKSIEQTREIMASEMQVFKYFILEI